MSTKPCISVITPANPLTITEIVDTAVSIDRASVNVPVVGYPG